MTCCFFSVMVTYEGRVKSSYDDVISTVDDIFTNEI